MFDNKLPLFTENLQQVAFQTCKACILYHQMLFIYFNSFKITAHKVLQQMAKESKLNFTGNMVKQL